MLCLNNLLLHDLLIITFPLDFVSSPRAYQCMDEQNKPAYTRMVLIENIKFYFKSENSLPVKLAVQLF